MKALELVAALLLSPLAVLGGPPGVLGFTLCLCALAVVGAAREKERDERAARAAYERLQAAADSARRAA